MVRLHGPIVPKHMLTLSWLREWLFAQVAVAADRRVWRFIRRSPDHAATEYVSLMAQTVDIYRRLFVRLQDDGIHEVLEVGPGAISLPAIGNAMLPRPLRYVALEPDTCMHARLSEFCRGMGTDVTLLPECYDARTDGTDARCVVFEHSLEDMFLASATTPLGQAGPVDPPSVPSCEGFVRSVLRQSAESEFGAIVFHHYRVPFLSPSIRAYLDPRVSQVLAERGAFESSGLWRRIDVSHSQRLADEVWRVYVRGTKWP